MDQISKQEAETLRRSNFVFTLLLWVAFSSPFLHYPCLKKKHNIVLFADTHILLK